VCACMCVVGGGRGIKRTSGMSHFRYNEFSRSVAISIFLMPQPYVYKGGREEKRGRTLDIPHGSIYHLGTPNEFRPTQFPTIFTGLFFSSHGKNSRYGFIVQFFGDSRDCTV